MALRTATVDRFFVARLEGSVDRDQVDRIVREAGEAARKLGKPVVYCGVNAPGLEPPDAPMRAYIMERAQDLLVHATTLEIVMEGDGLRSSLLRTVVRGMVTLSRTRRPGRPRTHIHASVRDAIDRSRGELSLPPAEIERRLAELGMISTGVVRGADPT